MRSSNLIRLAVAPIRIAEGLAMLLTLGRYGPQWEMRFLVWNSRREMERHDPPKVKP